MEIKDKIQSSGTRPVELAGWTWSFVFEKQKLFVTINHDGNRLLEIFATELLDERFTVGISKLLEDESVKVEKIICDLEELTGTSVIEFADGRIINSPEHAVAECLRLAETYLSDQKRKLNRK